MDIARGGIRRVGTRRLVTHQRLRSLVYSVKVDVGKFEVSLAPLAGSFQSYCGIIWSSREGDARNSVKPALIDLRPQRGAGECRVIVISYGDGHIGIVLVGRSKNLVQNLELNVVIPGVRTN